MNQNNRKKRIASVALNGAIFLLTVVSIIEHYCLYGTETFIYFTTDSNIFCGIAGLAACIDGISALKENRDLRKWVLLLKYAGTIGLAITFLTVMFFLGPTTGYADLFIGGSIYLHGVGPVMAILSFIFFDGCGRLEKKLNPVGMLPVLIYEVVYAVNVVAVRVWEDFYGFTAFLPWYVACIAMTAAAFLCSHVIRLLHNKAA